MLVELCGGIEKAPAIFDRAMSYETMTSVGLFPGAAETLTALRGHNVFTVVLTNRTERQLNAARRFLRDQGLEWCDLVGMGPEERIPYCIERGIDVIVDDRPQTLRAAAAAGLRAFAVLYPYNVGVVEDLGLAHGRTWSELAPSLLQAFGLDLATELRPRQYEVE